MKQKFKINNIDVSIESDRTSLILFIDSFNIVLDEEYSLSCEFNEYKNDEFVRIYNPEKEYTLMSSSGSIALEFVSRTSNIFISYEKGLSLSVILL